MLVGVDIGGTFTDLVVSEGGALRIHKLLSTPRSPADAMLAGLEALGVTPGARISHGTTVATNAILERKGARTALITTQGFRDLLFIGRQNRPDLYALQPTLPPPLIPRRWCYEVPERLDHTGAVLTPLDLGALDAIIDDMVAEGIEAVAVCFLYSYVNPAHERAARARILAHGALAEWQVSLSCEVLPEFREYERASTTALDAYVRPVVTRYLARLEAALPRQSRLLVMKSDGGVVSAEAARRQAAHTALSGPAAGVIGAFHVASLAGFNHIITLDMGGTSTDVALCPGAPGRRAEAELDGLPLRLRLLDIETIGAGGGSIARLDAGGALRVGPESAGADPGPIAYGRGGAQVTVSDANVVLGRLPSRHFLGGRMALDADAAYRALAGLGARMGMSAEEAARGVIDVANVNIDRALRRVSIARGHDPRAFTLVAFGGAGPLHACAVAERLEIPRVLVPRYPGVLCALGLLMADITRDYSRTALQPATADSRAALGKLYDELFQQAYDDLRAEGIADGDMAFHALADLRYSGQSFELTVPLTDDLAGAFHQAHRQRYGHALPERPVEVVTLRVQAVGRVAKPVLAPEPVMPRQPPPADLSAALPAYDRAALPPGAHISGPALVRQLDSTAFVAAGWSARVDGYYNLILER
ncbi:MAG: hydantoinase/oxoprolinase family protein, partial [Aggregatilineales bacterium]